MNNSLPIKPGKEGKVGALSLGVGDTMGKDEKRRDSMRCGV